MYIDNEYAGSRLIGTMVRHKGRAVQVNDVVDDLQCLVYDLLNDNSYLVHLDELELKSPPLGFVNGRGGCVYLSRRPMRRDWRQGVRTNTVLKQTRYVGSINSTLIAQCILGKFPKVSTALTKLRVGIPEVAISREFSLTRVGTATIINFKWYGGVGRLTAKGPNFNTSWEYLESRFKEAV